MRFGQHPLASFKWFRSACLRVLRGKWFFCQYRLRCVGALPAALALTSLALSVARAATIPQPRPLLRVGTSGDYAPFSLTTDSGRSVGLDVDISESLARDLGFEVRFVGFTWPALAQRLAAGEFDLVVSGVTMRPERALAGRFTRPYVITGAVVLVRSADATRLADAAALDQPTVRLVVNRGGHLEHVARSHFPRAVIEPIDDNRALPRRVLDGSADAAVTDSAEVRDWIRPELGAVGPFTHDYKAILLPPDSSELAARIDTWLDQRERDGWLPQLRERWLGKPAPSGAADAQREAIAAFMRLRLELMPAVAAAKRAAGLPIVDPDQEGRVLRRAAALARRRPAQVEALYRLLIEIAKSVQDQPSAPAPATLVALRAAIARIDEQLIAEMNRPLSGTPPEWQIVLDRALDLPGVDASARQRLAAVLGEEVGSRR